MFAFCLALGMARWRMTRLKKKKKEKKKKKAGSVLLMIPVIANELGNRQKGQGGEAESQQANSKEKKKGPKKNALPLRMIRFSVHTHGNYHCQPFLLFATLITTCPAEVFSFL